MRRGVVQGNDQEEPNKSAFRTKNYEPAIPSVKFIMSDMKNNEVMIKIADPYSHYFLSFVGGKRYRVLDV